MAKVCDGNIIVSSNSSHTIMFTFRLIPLRKVWILLSPTPAIDRIVSVFFYKDGYGIKWTMKVDMPLNKDPTETN